MLTDRDMAIAEWIGRQGAVRAEHVMIRFSIGRTATYRRLHELVDFGLVRRHSPPRSSHGSTGKRS